MSERWTIAQLKEYIEARLAAGEVLTDTLRQLYDDKINAARDSNRERIESLHRELETRFEASKIAIDKAEYAQEKRNESMNEFRLQLSDQAKSFMPRTECEASIGQLDKEVDRNRGQLIQILARGEGKTSITGPLWAAAGAVITALIVAAILAMTGRSNEHINTNSERIIQLEQQLLRQGKP